MALSPGEDEKADVTDQVPSGLMARLKGGAKRTEEGLELDGKHGSYADLDPYEFGGSTSFEFRVRYANFDTDFARVFSFGQNNGNDMFLFTTRTMVEKRELPAVASRWSLREVSLPMRSLGT